MNSPKYKKYPYENPLDLEVHLPGDEKAKLLKLKEKIIVDLQKKENLDKAIVIIKQWLSK